MSHWNSVKEFLSHYEYKKRCVSEEIMVKKAEFNILETLCSDLRTLDDDLKKDQKVKK